MNLFSIACAVMLALQGIPTAAQQAGTVSGVLKDQAGKPLAGVRMAAVAKPEVAGDTLSSSAMASIAQTDTEGRYTLENVPPGRYYIAAGRVDMQTYFPGTQQMTAAGDMLIAAGAKIGGIDFTLDAASSGRAGMSGIFGVGGTSSVVVRSPNVAIPVAVTVEGGGAWPISGKGKLTTIVVTNVNGGSPSMLNLGSVTITNAQVGGYQVTIENLPETFVVKSMTYDSTDLLKDTLKLTPANLLPVVMIYQVSMATPGGAIQTQQGTSSGSAIWASGAPMAQPSPIIVTLARVTPKNATGVSVSGILNVPGIRTLFVSGIPGNTYSNDTFDVYGVPPGRHNIATRDNPYSSAALGTSVTVGNRDLTGIGLDEIAALPKSIWDAGSGRAQKNHPAGIVPLARVAGTVIEEESKKPITEGNVIIRGYNNYGKSVPLDSEGHFEAPNLLPGSYEIEIQAFGHTNGKRDIELDDEDLKIDMSARKLF